MIYYPELGWQDQVTTVEYIRADGNSLPLLVIFMGKNTKRQWVLHNAPIEQYISCNSKGQISNDHCLKWLYKCFEPLTHEKSYSRKRILLYNGYDSHITTGFILHCIQNNIILMILPLHSSHVLQPLDVGYFGPLKMALLSQIDHLIHMSISRIQNIEWLKAYIKALSIALTSQNILSGWRISSFCSLFYSL